MTLKESLTGNQLIHCRRLIRLLQRLAEDEDYDEAMWIPDNEVCVWIDTKYSDKTFSGTDLTLLECDSTNPTLVKYFTEDNMDDREYWREYLAQAASRKPQD